MAEYLPEITTESVCSLEGKRELIEECESIWKQMEECQSKLMRLEMGTSRMSDAKLSFQLPRMLMKALRAEHNQWQNRSPEIISTNPDVLLSLGKEELQKVKNQLEMVLSTVQSKNKQLEEDLKREQQWYEEQEQLLYAFQRKANTQVGQLSTKSLKMRSLNELENKILQLKSVKEELLDALGKFLSDHFPLPETGRSAKKKGSSEEPSVELITLHEILEMLVNKLMSTPHEPYVTINDSFWPPYIELLLRSGIALRHPEDAKKIRLEAFHM
ncbi:centromere protein K [Athene cunicularia]|uniref:centromere protein K n=1 Tax=Athene cunicularia TaxID=194338 RepID=UPI000EF6FBEF|nr:centromere protein K [Athene cunicularia]